MHYLNLTFAILSFLAWGGLFFVYYRGRIIPWFVNHFTREKKVQASEENSLFGGASPLPFKYETEEESRKAREKEIQKIEEALQREKDAAMQETPDPIPNERQKESSHDTSS